MAHSIAVISGKGGVGKTFLSVNISAAIAAYGHRTLIIDTDSGMCNADIVLHKSDSFVYDLSDIAAGYCSLDDALIDVWNNGALSLIASAKNPDFVPSADFLKKLIAEAAKSFEYIIIDAPAGAGLAVQNVISASDRVVIVTNPPKEAVLPAAAVSDTAWRIAPKTPVYVVVNKIDRKGIAPGDMSPDRIIDICYARLLGIVYKTDNIEKARRDGRVFVSCKYTESCQIRNIASRICGESVPLLI